MSSLKFVREINTAQFWRKSLGDQEYVKFDPDDMFRWYEALEQRGKEEIRALIAERACRVRITHLHGVVDKAPHPPMPIIEAWLDSKNTFSLAPVWCTVAILLVFSSTFGRSLYGCTQLKDVNPLVLKPVQTNVMMTQGPVLVPPMPSSQASMPQSIPAPASVASPPTGQTSAAH